MTRISAIRTVAVGAALALALTACGLIPPQDIGDPFALDGRDVTLSETASSATVEAAQFTSCADAAVDGTHCAAFGPATFDDPDLPSVASSLIAAMEVDAGLAATITVAGGVEPAQVTVNAFALSLTLEDQETGDIVTFDARVTPSSPVVFESVGGGEYVASDVTALGMRLDVGGNDLGTVKDILTGGGANSASGVVVLDLSEPFITAIDVTLSSEGTTVSF